MIKTLKGKMVALGGLLILVLGSIMGVLWIYGERAGLRADFGEVNLMSEMEENPVVLGLREDVENIWMLSLVGMGVVFVVLVMAVLILKKPLSEKERDEHEIRLASEIQKELLPKKVPEMKNVEIAATVKPALKVGGDVFDVIKVKEEVLLYVGDVSGHGVAAGLISGMTNALVFGFAKKMKRTNELLGAINEAIWPKTKSGNYVTMLMGRWNDEERVLRMTNAGHEPAILWRAGKKQVKELSKGGSPIGMFEEMPKKLVEKKLKLGKGDVMLFFTDGVNETVNLDGKMFGREGIKKVMREAGGRKWSAKKVKDELVRAVFKWGEGCEQRDDVTILVMKGR